MFELNPILNLQDYIKDSNNPFINSRVINYVLSNMAHNDFSKVMADYFIDINENIEMTDNKVSAQRFFKENKADIIEWMTRMSKNDFTSSTIRAIQTFISQKTQHNFNADLIAKILYTDNESIDEYAFIVQTINKMVFSHISDVFKEANKGHEYEGVDENLIKYLSLLGCGRFITKDVRLVKAYLNNVNPFTFQKAIEARFDIIRKSKTTVELSDGELFYRSNTQALQSWIENYSKDNGKYSTLSFVLKMTQEENPNLVIDLDDVGMVLFANDESNKYYQQITRTVYEFFSLQLQADYFCFLSKRRVI